MSEQLGEDPIHLTNVHENDRVPGDMVALICDVFRRDMWETDGNDGSETEDLIIVEL